MKKMISAGAIALAALVPFTLASPAYAVLDRSSITFDCTQYVDGENDLGLLAGESTVITFVNCDGSDFTIVDALDSGNAVDHNENVLTLTPAPITNDPYVVTVFEFASLSVYSADSGYEEDVRITVGNLTADPSGALLATEDATIPLNGPEFDIAVETDEFNEVQLAGIAGCVIMPGAHVYGTIDITVTEAGLFTFRVIDTVPAEDDLYFNIPESPLGDNFLALYDEFNPADAEAGLLGCNDDGDDWAIDEWDETKLIEDESGMGDSFVETSTGYLLDDQFPWFGAELELGTYTLVAATWGPMSSAEWTAGENQDGNIWDAVDGTITYEMWGPEGALVVGTAEPELAETGFSGSIAIWAGIGLVGTAAAFAVARRRNQLV